MREYDFKLWRGLVKFFAFTPLKGLMIQNGTAYGYDPTSLYECDCPTFGLDGIE